MLGAVSPQTGKIHYSPNIPGLEDFDVAAHLMETLRVRIILDNDANLAVLGEKWSGAAQSILGSTRFSACAASSAPRCPAP